MSPLDRSLVRVGLALGLLGLTALPAAASDDDSYGYFRVIEGSATLMQNSAGDTDRQPAEINQPVLAGDRIWVPNQSRAEIVLADRNLLRLDGGSEVTLEQLAASPDRDDPASVIRLHDGNILLTVTTDSLGDQLPRVDTPNATVYTQHYGTYRITASQGRFTEVVVRRGKAEVVTDRSSEIVKADESAYVEGERYADVDVESAGSYDALERWADRLEGEARYADNDYIDDDLRYHAAPLARHGSWLHIGGRPYWRPRVDVGWRPYWQGRWAYTPAGLTWISYEPWGWVPYHYGTWDYVPAHGWVWAPGRRWAPAWVYWYWGPSYVGWCPTGYYTSFYRDRYSHFRHGVYGWAGGGHWDAWDRWSFIRHDYFRGYRNGYRDGYRDGRRDDHWDVRRYAVPRDELRRRGEIDRGVITTDTRPLRPDTWGEPRTAIGVLTRDRGRDANGASGGLPDVTPFIQRRPDLPDTVVRTVVPWDQGGQAGGRPRVAEGPRGSSPWEGGVMSTDPSQEPRRVRRERPAPGGPTVGETPRVRVPQGGGVVIDREGERPRSSRPQAGEGGGAPRPESIGRRDSNGERGGASEPRTRVLRETTPRDNGRDSGGESPRSRRPEAGSPGGSPRPSRPEQDAPPPSSYRRPNPPQSYESPRNQEREQERDRARQQEQDRARESERERAREQQMERERQMDRERQREREAPPSYSPPSRPERREREEARPSEPPRHESARPAERERGGSRGGESRGGDRGDQSGSRGSRSRPPGDGGL